MQKRFVIHSLRIGTNNFSVSIFYTLVFYIALLLSNIFTTYGYPYQYYPLNECIFFYPTTSAPKDQLALSLLDKWVGRLKKYTLSSLFFSFLGGGDFQSWATNKCNNHLWKRRIFFHDISNFIQKNMIMLVIGIFQRKSHGFRWLYIHILSSLWGWKVITFYVSFTVHLKKRWCICSLRTLLQLYTTRQTS